MEVAFSTSGFLHNTLGRDLYVFSKMHNVVQDIDPRLSKLFLESRIADDLTLRSTKMQREEIDIKE